MNAEKKELLTQSIYQERTARVRAEQELAATTDELAELQKQYQQLNAQLSRQLAVKDQELLRSDQEHRQLIESIQDVIYKLAPADGTFTFVSPVVEKMLGYTEADLLGKPYTVLIPPVQQDTVRNFYLNMFREQVDNSYHELQILRKDGRLTWIGQTVRRIVYDDGTSELVAVARDIADCKRAEDALLDAQLRLSTILSCSESAVMVEDENHTIVLINKLFCDLFSLDQAAMQPETPVCSIAFNLVAHLFEKPDDYLTRIDELLQKRQVVIGDNLCMVDGRRFERDFIPVFRQGQYMGHLWRYTDVTDKVVAREQLRRSEEKYRGIMNNMELGLLEVDSHQVIIRAYDQFCKMMGYTPDELVGRHAAELFLQPDGRAVVAKQQLLRRQGLASSYEVPLRHKNGDTIWMLVSGAPILDEHGTISGSIGIHYNLTERKQLELEVEKAHKQTEESRQAEKQFLANMSHEIRTPLNAIIGMTHLLYDTRPNQEQLEYMDIIRSSADFLHTLISDLLDMAKIEAGRVEVSKQPFDLAGLLRSLQKIFQMRLQKRPVTVDVLLDARITGKYLGDELLLNQILLNLLGNAEKFTEEGSIMLTARVRRKEANRTWIEFQVSDTGIGIPADERQRIFQKFQQVSPQGHKHKGTGLGLSITKQLIELQEGKISVRSEEGEGSTFTFSLPYELILPEETAEPGAPALHVGDKRVENLSILVAEDNLMNQRYVSGLLKKWGINFTVADDGQQAVDLCRKQTFDLILMDIQMPVLDGYEATIAIRSIDNQNQQTTIIALTASAMLDQKEMAIKAGMDGFLSKPFPPDKLLTMLRQHITKEQATVVDHVAEGIAVHPLDYDHLSELYGTDTDYAASMFELFLNTIVTEFDAFEILIQQKRWEDVRQLAHKLKPTLSLVGLSDLEAVMNQLENMMLTKPDFTAVQQLWHTFRAELISRQPLLQTQWQTYLTNK